MARVLPFGRRLFLTLIPAFLPCIGLSMALARPAAAQTGDTVMHYRTYPGEDLDDVARKLDTSARVVRRLNGDKIGPDGELEPYTLLAVPTTPENEGWVTGAKAPPPPARPAAKAPERTAPPRPAAPKPAPAAPSRPADNQPPAPAPETYQTRDTPITYDAETTAPLWLSAGRFLAALGLIVALVYGFLRLVKRFGWEAPLAQWGSRFSPAPSKAPRAVGTGLLQGAAPGGDFDDHLRAARGGRGDAASATGEDGPRPEKQPPTLLGDGRKADSTTRTQAADTNPDDDQIPQTSLEDALRGRRKRGA